MRRVWSLLFVVVAVAGACDSDSSRPSSEDDPAWELKADSVNLGLLVLDYLTYALEGGLLSYYPPCDGCGTDSLPFLVDIAWPVDFGSVTFRYAPTGDSVFAGTVIWMGLGKILYPDTLETPESFGMLGDPVEQPEDPERYDLFIGLEDEVLTAKTDSAWHAVHSLDLVHAFSGSGFRVGYHLYPPTVGAFHPGEAKWIVFLYREGR